LENNADSRQSLEILAPLPPPPHRPTSRPHPHVFSLNTAGSNRMLFSCPTERDLALWVTALRLSAYEKSRLEEIYTGHVLKTFYSGRPGQIVEPRSPLVRGRLEGWVRVRVMGGTEWKRLWAVLTVAGGASAAPREEEKDGKEKKRRSFFGKGGDKEKEHATPAPPSNPSAYATACFYTAPPRGAKTAKGGPAFPPVLTMTNVTQALVPACIATMQADVLSQVCRLSRTSRAHWPIKLTQGSRSDRR
jgi:CCR4-NOT transcriptional complex subunit CAF120